MKTCNQCGQEKPLCEFKLIKSNGKYKSNCCLCDKEYMKLYREKNKDKIIIQKQLWYLSNIEHNTEKRKVYYINNKEYVKSKAKKYCEDNPEKIKENKQEYYNKNKRLIISRHNEYNKNRKKVDPVFKLSVNIRTNIYYNLTRAKTSKLNKTTDMLGCSFDELKLHLESKFEPWMNWDNYGKYNGEFSYGWDIDHIVPTSSAICENELLELFNYTNLQPLCSKVNRDIKRHL